MNILQTNVWTLKLNVISISKSIRSKQIIWIKYDVLIKVLKKKYLFIFNSHIVSIVLPSADDACYYRLKLSVMPGRYYQEAIPFSIEPIDANDIFTPK